MPRNFVCCVPGCFNASGNPEITLHAFPTPPERRRQWLKSLGLTGLRITQTTRVCSAHFTPDDFHGSGYLKRDANPSISACLLRSQPSVSSTSPGGLGNLKRKAVPSIPASHSRMRHESSFEKSPPVTLIGNGESPTRSAADDGCSEVVTNQEMDESGIMDNVKQELCRVCGNKDDTLISIFENSSIENTSVSLVKMLEMYLPLKIQDDDKLPSKICSKCSCMLNQWHKLYITCVAADKTFRSMFCQGNLEGSGDVPVTRLPEDVIHFTICDESSIEDPVLKMKENVNENGYLRISKSDGNVDDKCDYSKDKTCCTVTISGEEEIKFPEIRRYHFPQISCRYCCDLFDDRSSWRNHYGSCKESLTICEECGKIIHRKNLMTHKFQYHSTKKLCEKCGKRFYPRFLWYHLLTHHSETYYCDLCWKIFKTKMGHQRHLIRHKIGEIKTTYKVNTLRKEDKIVFVCPVCKLNFGDKQSLIIHLNKSKFVKCPVCRVQLNNEKLLYRHKCKKWTCQYCFRNFCNKTVLMGHERIHTGENPYKCNICDLSFKTGSVRNAHKRTVHGDPGHKCTYCPKKYYLASRLRSHMDIHEGVRYPCPLCDKPLKRSDTLREHIKLHKMGRI